MKISIRNVLIKVLNISDEVEIVNEAGELTGYEEWREELRAPTEEMKHMQEQLVGGKMKTTTERQCMKMVQKPNALKNKEKVTHCLKKPISENKVYRIIQRPKKREIKTITDNSLKWLVNDRDGQSRSVTNPVLQTHERKEKSNEQTADSLLKIPENLLQRQLNQYQTIEKHNDTRWISTDKSERNPYEVRHHAQQTQEGQSQTQEFGIKKQNESILKYVLTNTDQIEERYIESNGECQELDIERVEAWPLDSSFPVTEKVCNDLNIHSQPIEKWGHMMEEGRQQVENRARNILKRKKQRDLCSFDRRKSWWPASAAERRTQMLEKLKKHKENEDSSSASVQALQQWKEARW